MLEFMDNPTIRAVEAATRTGLDVDAAAMLVIQSDGHADAAAQTIAVLAHAGDGNTHPVLVFDPADDAQRERAHLAYGEVMALAIALGGTITGEHGVGRLKRPWLGDYLGDDVLELNERIKKALDPQGIMNPGAVFAG